jgi:hypothetical protein
MPGHDVEMCCLSFVMPALVAGIHVYAGVGNVGWAKARPPQAERAVPTKAFVRKC